MTHHPETEPLLQPPFPVEQWSRHKFYVHPFDRYATDKGVSTMGAFFNEALENVGNIDDLTSVEEAGWMDDAVNLNTDWRMVAMVDKMPPLHTIVSKSTEEGHFADAALTRARFELAAGKDPVMNDVEPSHGMNNSLWTYLSDGTPAIVRFRHMHIGEGLNYDASALSLQLRRPLSGEKPWEEKPIMRRAAASVLGLVRRKRSN